jgi:hypothetical protein
LRHLRRLAETLYRRNLVFASLDAYGVEPAGVVGRSFTNFSSSSLKRAG